VHAYSGEEAAGYAAEVATMVAVAVDAVSWGEVMAHHLGVARGRSGQDQD
jgi:4-hydroxy-2-oxoheptanedioate aldolase